MMKLLSVAVILLASAGISFGQAAGGGVPGPSQGGPPTGAASNCLTGTYPGPGLSSPCVVAGVAGQAIAPSSVIAKVISGVSYSANYPGSDFGARVNAAMVDASNLSNGNSTGIVSSFGDSFGQTTQITVPSPAVAQGITWQLPAGMFNQVTLTDGTKYAVLQHGKTRIECIGVQEGGCIFNNNSTANNIYAMYGTADDNSYFYMNGVYFGNGLGGSAGSTFASGHMCIITNGSDGSVWSNNQCFDAAVSDPNNGSVLLIKPTSSEQLGFHSRLENNTSDSEWGATACDVELTSGGTAQVAALDFIDNTCNSHGATASGNPNFVCHDTVGASSIITISGALYEEGQGVPMSAPFNYINGCRSVSFNGQLTVEPTGGSATTSPIIEVSALYPTSLRVESGQAYGGSSFSSGAWTLPATVVRQDGITTDCGTPPCNVATTDNLGNFIGYETGNQQLQNLSVTSPAITVGALSYAEINIQGVAVLGIASSPAVVGSVHISPGGAPVSALATTSWTSATGNAVACYATAVSSAPVTSVSDGTNTYTAAAQTTAASGQTAGWWYSLNITGVTHAVTATNSGSAAIYGIQCFEISNIATTGAVDVNPSTGASGSSGTTATTAPFSTTYAPEIALIGMTQNGAGLTHSAGSGYTFGATDGFGAGGTEYQVFSALQPNATASMGFSSSTQWMISPLTLKANSTVLGPGVFTTLKVGGSQTLTSVQGTAGTKLPAASGTFINGNLRSTNSTGDEVDSGVAASTVSRVSNAITSATAGSGISAVTCTTAACTNLRGTYTMTATTVSAGATILTLGWPTTTTAYACLVSQDGGTLAIAPSHSVATATGMAIVSDLAITSGSIGIDYSCQP